MKVKTIFLFILLIKVHLAAFSQIENITWQQCYGTENWDKAYAVAKFNAGYLFGITISTDGPGITNFHGNGMADAWIVNTDSAGNILWERCYGGSEGDGPEKIIPIDSNRIYLLNASASTDGDVQSENNGWSDIWVVKIDSFGNIIWEDCYGGPNVDEVRDGLLTPDGGLLLMARVSAAGGDISQHFGLGDVWLCKIDSLGIIQWEISLGNQGHDNALKMKLTSDTTFVVLAGFRESGGMVECEHMGIPSDGLDVWIVEIDIKGNILRQLCYGGSKDDLGRDIIKINDGYVFTASTTSNDGDVSGLHGSQDIWVVKIDDDGNIVWQKCIGGSSYEWPIYITKTEDNGYIVTGNTRSNDGDVSHNNSINTDESDIWVIKLTSEGELEWEHCFGGLMTERFWGKHSVLKKSDYNYVFAAQSDNVSFDVECDLYGFMDIDAWVFEVKDCSLYMPQTPNQPNGPDTLCYTTDSTSMYAINTATGAWGYEWKIEPENAGTLLEDTLTVYVTWNQQYEGEVAVSVRSFNDCGNSDWSAEKTTWVYNCVGIKEINTAGYALKVYPNPVSSKFEIRCSIFEIQNTTIEIFDTFGSKVEEINVHKGQDEVEVDVNRWRKGIYLVKLSDGKNYYGIMKVLIQ